MTQVIVSVHVYTEFRKSIHQTIRTMRLIPVTPEEARNPPSGYGFFALVHDGRLLIDHYLRATRFRKILNKKLKWFMSIETAALV